MPDPHSRGAGAAPLSCHAIEITLRDVWGDLFGRQVGAFDDFFELGGDSVTVIDMVLAARERGIDVRSSTALRNPTPARLAEALTVRAEGSPTGPDGPVIGALEIGAADLRRVRTPVWPDGLGPLPVAHTGSGAPLYVVHSDSHVQAERAAVAAWGAERPVRGFLLPGTHGPLPPSTGIADMARRYAEAVLQEQPTGPYRLAGFEYGAVIAFDMARQLCARGAEVVLLALIRPPAVGVASSTVPDLAELLRLRCAALRRRFGLTGDESAAEILAAARRAGWYDNQLRPADLPRAQLAWAELALAARAYEPGRYEGPGLLVQDRMDAAATERAWGEVTIGLDTLWFDHGVASPLPILSDRALAQSMRKALAR